MRVRKYFVNRIKRTLCVTVVVVCSERLFALLDAHRQIQLDETFVDARGYTPMHYAAANGHVALVEGLCARAPLLIEAIDARGNTPLILATQQLNVDAVRFNVV
jgi:cellulase/cellobiase CelA1